MFNISFFTQNNAENGEMTPFERFKLYTYIQKYNPKYVLETGCGTGFGSTFYILKALTHNNNDGKLFTCDPLRTPEKLIKDYKNTLFYYKVNSDVLIKSLKPYQIKPNFIFFDGPELENVALDDFKNLEDYVEIGSVFSMHDWCTETRGYDGNVSIKAKLIKPYIQKSDKWELIEELSGTNKNSEKNDMPYDSVGLCFYKKIK